VLPEISESPCNALIRQSVRQGRAKADNQIKFSLKMKASHIAHMVLTIRVHGTRGSYKPFIDVQTDNTRPFVPKTPAKRSGGAAHI
jgi:hypothetical protein